MTSCPHLFFSDVAIGHVSNDDGDAPSMSSHGRAFGNHRELELRNHEVARANRSNSALETGHKVPLLGNSPGRSSNLDA